MNKWISLGLFLLLCLVVEFTAGMFTQSSVHSWYPTLIKPSWTPPPWLFGPVWTILYILMGISVWRIWLSKAKENKTLPYSLWGIQLFLNFIWSFLFFELHSPFYAMIDIGFLWLAVLATIISFHRIDQIAAYLLIPYLLWISFAASLNIAIWMRY